MSITKNKGLSFPGRSVLDGGDFGPGNGSQAGNGPDLYRRQKSFPGGERPSLRGVWGNPYVVGAQGTERERDLGRCTNMSVEVLHDASALPAGLAQAWRVAAPHVRALIAGEMQPGRGLIVLHDGSDTVCAVLPLGHIADLADRGGFSARRQILTPAPGMVRAVLMSAEQIAVLRLAWPGRGAAA